MAYTLAMSTIRTRCFQRADMENTTLVSTAEANALISEKFGELYGVVCDAGSRYFETTQTITATGATSYDEPTDHRSTMRIVHVGSDGRRRPIPKATRLDVEALSGQTGDAVCFEHIDDQIYFYPNPSSGTYVMIYIPQPPDLTDYGDSEIVDVCDESGLAFLIWGVSVLMKSKQESDVRLAMDREAAAKQRLLEWAVNRLMEDGHVRQEPDWDVPSHRAEWWRYR